MLGGVSAVAERHVAIALSRGGAKKTYSHRDPNEDTCAFAFSDYGTLIAVADGHAGCEASQIAVERLIEHHAARLAAPVATGLAARWSLDSFELICDLHREIVRRADGYAEHPPRTTLALALARPADDFLGWISMGDSLLYQVTSDGIRELAGEPERVSYMGSPRDDRDSLNGRYQAGSTALAGSRALVLATDGLSEHGIGVADPPGAVQDAVDRAGDGRAEDLRPLETARGLAHTALASHRARRSGDNIATAVAWIG